MNKFVVASALIIFVVSHAKNCFPRKMSVKLDHLKFDFKADKQGADSVEDITWTQSWSGNGNTQTTEGVSSVQFKQPLEYSVDVKFFQNYDFAKQVKFVFHSWDEAKIFNMKPHEGLVHDGPNYRSYRTKEVRLCLES